MFPLPWLVKLFASTGASMVPKSKGYLKNKNWFKRPLGPFCFLQSSTGASILDNRINLAQA
jgi:hypothetical protein